MILTLPICPFFSVVISKKVIIRCYVRVTQKQIFSIASWYKKRDANALVLDIFCKVPVFKEEFHSLFFYNPTVAAAFPYVSTSVCSYKDFGKKTGVWEGTELSAFSLITNIFHLPLFSSSSRGPLPEYVILDDF